MSLVDLIKVAGADAVQAGNPVAVMYGVVTKTNPLEVNVDQRFTLTEEFLVMTEGITSYSVSLPLAHAHTYVDDDGEVEATKEAGGALTTVTVTVRSGLSAGDKVVLLRVQGGQQYVILDKVVG